MHEFLMPGFKALTT